MKFKGFPTEGIAFLRELKKHNDREWFTPKLDEYKRLVREPMVELVHSLHVEMLRFAPAYVGEPAQTERQRLGIWVVLFLLVLTGFAWLLKREYWKDVH